MEIVICLGIKIIVCDLRLTFFLIFHGERQVWKIQKMEILSCFKIVVVRQVQKINQYKQNTEIITRLGI